MRGRWNELALTALGAALSIVVTVFPDYLDIGGLRPWVPAVFALGATTLGVASAFAFRAQRTRQTARDDDRTPVDKRIAEATTALHLSAQLIDELQAELRTRMTALERVQAESAEYERLAALKKDEAEAVSRLVSTVVSEANTKLAKSSKRDAWLFYALGVLTPIPIGVALDIWLR